MTAELAIALPAVVLVLAACVGALQLAAAQVRLQDAAALGARAAARGDPLTSALASAPGSSMSAWHEGVLVCAAASSAVRWLPGFPPVELAASSCAASER